MKLRRTSLLSAVFSGVSPLSAATGALIIGLLFGCGTSSTNNDGGEPNRELAEVTADLPRDGYNAFLNGPTPTPNPQAAPTVSSSGSAVGGGAFIITRFLWKPVSDSNGNVAVLVDPTEVDVVVNGAVVETLNNVGPSNGRGTTARGELPGCDYGEGGTVIVTFFRNGQQIGLADGRSSVNVGDGCERIEFDL